MSEFFDLFTDAFILRVVVWNPALLHRPVGGGYDGEVRLGREHRFHLLALLRILSPDFGVPGSNLAPTGKGVMKVIHALEGPVKMQACRRHLSGLSRLHLVLCWIVVGLLCRIHEHPLLNRLSSHLRFRERKLPLVSQLLFLRGQAMGPLPILGRLVGEERSALVSGLQLFDLRSVVINPLWLDFNRRLLAMLMLEMRGIKWLMLIEGLVLT